MLFDAKCCTHVRQPAIADQLGPQVGAGTHREIGVVAINEFGGGEPQHRITEELQPFQVAGPAARHVGEGLIHQGEELTVDGDLSVEALDQVGELCGAGWIHKDS